MDIITSSAVRVREFGRKAVRKEDGAGLVEYALLVALVAIALITALTLLGGSLSTFFSNAGTTIGNLANG